MFKNNTTIREAERYSSITVLDEFQMAKPRQKLPNGKMKNTKMFPPFTMFYINKTDALQPVTIILERIFIIGSSPLALSSTEELCTKRLFSFPNMFHVSEDDDDDYSPNVVNMAPIAWGHLDMARRKRMSLNSVVNTILARLDRIDRKSKKVFLSNNLSYSYDKMLLCVDTASFSLQNHFMSRKGVKNMQNFFTVESLTSAKACLDYFQNTNEKLRKDGYVIILGQNLHALAMINSLIEVGTPAKSILLVTIDEDNSNKEELFEDDSIRDKVIHQLKSIGVRIKTYVLVDFKKDSKRNVINTIIFSKNEELVEASCLMLINCNKPAINENLMKVLDEADLVLLDDKVIINDKFETNDQNILAMGSGTRFDKISAAKLNIAIGDNINNIIFKTHIVDQLLLQTNLNIQHEENDQKKINNCFSTHLERHLPGGYTYLFLSNQENVSKLKCLQTSSKV